jgi:sarcosine oxidase subunit gamma
MRMPTTKVPRIFPFAAGGPAADVQLMSGSGAPICLTDLTAMPRFGLKGPGSTTWLTGQGIILPPINQIGEHGELKVLRLGHEDIVLLGVDTAACQALDLLRAQWSHAVGMRGYSSWREDGWAWMRLSGPYLPEVMAKLCAVDLREGRFEANEILQTRVAHQEAVIFCTQTDGVTGFNILFDTTSSAYFARAVHSAAREFADNLSREEICT